MDDQRLMRIEEQLTALKQQVSRAMELSGNNNKRLDAIEEWKDGHDLGDIAEGVNKLVTTFYGDKKYGEDGLMPEIRRIVENSKFNKRFAILLGGFVGITGIPDVVSFIATLL